MPTQREGGCRAPEDWELRKSHGRAYKKDIHDLRESPALEIIRMLQDLGVEVAYHDPFCPVIRDDGHTPLRGLSLRSVELTDTALGWADAVVIVTDHSRVDYQYVADAARLVVDARGVMRGYAGQAPVIGLSGQEQKRAVAAGGRS